MTDTNVRHLVLELHEPATTVTIACLVDPVPLDQTEHTLLAMFTTCPACRAVQAARVVVLDARGEGARP